VVVVVRYEVRRGWLPCHVVVGCVAAADSLMSELRTDSVSGSEASATDIGQSCRDGERCIAASVSDHRLLLPILRESFD